MRRTSEAVIKEIRNLIENSQMPLILLGEHLKVAQSVVRKVWETYPSDFRKHRKTACYSASKLGEKNPALGKRGAEIANWKGDCSDGKGYLTVIKPDWYTSRQRNSRVFKHHIVVCWELGLTAVPRGWCVHHCDYNPHNNAFDNLVLITLEDHARLHHWLRKGATTISKESTLKWVEANGTPWRGNDIVCSA